jgi:hypothetical protein
VLCSFRLSPFFVLDKVDAALDNLNVNVAKCGSLHLHKITLGGEGW